MFENKSLFGDGHLLPPRMIDSGALRHAGRISRDSKSRDGPFVASVPTDSDPRLAGAVRKTRDGSMTASLADRTAFSKTPQEWYEQEPRLHVLQILAFIKLRLKSKSVILLDFVSQFDCLRSPACRANRMHTGFVTRENFRRAIAATGCIKDISEQAFNVLADTFTQERAKLEFKNENINYVAVCEVLQGVSHQSNSYRNGTMLLDEKYEILRQQLLDTEYMAAFNSSSDDAPFARQPLSAAGERRFEELKRQLMHTIYADRVSARELLGDFDPYLNTSVSWMKKSTQRTPMICQGSGCISRSQYLRGMSRVAGRIGLNEDDYNLIFNKYKKNGAFNYLAFCSDVDPGFDELRAIFAPGGKE